MIRRATSRVVRPVRSRVKVSPVYTRGWAFLIRYVNIETRLLGRDFIVTPLWREMFNHGKTGDRATWRRWIASIVRRYRTASRQER